MFATAQLLPGDVGRAVLGRDAPPEAVAAYNKEHGTDRPAVVQYVDWLTSAVQGDFGESLAQSVPVWDIVQPALANSMKLALFAFLVFVPLGILGGILAGLRVGGPTDRGITVVGLSLAVIPEIVTGLVLILIFSIWLGWLPVTAQWEPGAGRYAGQAPDAASARPRDRPLRIHRADHASRCRRGARRGLHTNGLSQGLAALDCGATSRPAQRAHAYHRRRRDADRVLGRRPRRHRVPVQLPGIGLMTLTAAEQKDFTLLTAGVVIVGLGFLLVTLVADIIFALINPRIRYGMAE